MIRRATLGVLCALSLSASALAANPPALPVPVERNHRVTIECPVRTDSKAARVIRVSLLGADDALLGEETFCGVGPGDALVASFTFFSDEQQTVRCALDGKKRFATQAKVLSSKRSTAPRKPRRPKNLRIGLALSGGGFRAAAFHLGLMKKLEQHDLLGNVTVISTVSGGSIAGAAVALHWQEREKGLDVLEKYLSERKSIAVWSVLGGLLNPFSSPLAKLQKTYDRDLFDGKTLGDLQCDTCPKITINATSLNTGAAFAFVSGGKPGPKNAPKMGDYKSGGLIEGGNSRKNAKDLPIAAAVAASSAFPGAFNPLRLTHEYYNPETGGESRYEYVALTDAGVYDNLGWTALKRELRKKGGVKLDYVIGSDAGAPFRIDERPSKSGVGALRRSIDIMSQSSRTAALADLASRKKSVKPRSLFPVIGGTPKNPTPAQEKCAEQAGLVGTNLKSFSPDDMRLLTGHGATLMEARLRENTKLLSR